METNVFLAILSVATHSKFKWNKFQAKMNEVCDLLL